MPNRFAGCVCAVFIKTVSITEFLIYLHTSIRFNSEERTKLPVLLNIDGIVRFTSYIHIKTFEAQMNHQHCIVSFAFLRSYLHAD